MATTLEELGTMDELDGTTELLLGIMLDELGRADELDGTTELLLGTTLDELGGVTELELGTEELELGSCDTELCSCEPELGAVPTGYLELPGSKGLSRSNSTHPNKNANAKTNKNLTMRAS